MGGLAALKAGTKVPEAAKASGAPTRIVNQWFRGPREMPMGYFHFATNSYPMTHPALVMRTVRREVHALEARCTRRGHASLVLHGE